MRERVYVQDVKMEKCGDHKGEIWIRVSAANAPRGTSPSMSIKPGDALILEAAEYREPTPPPIDLIKEESSEVTHPTIADLEKMVDTHEILPDGEVRPKPTAPADEGEKTDNVCTVKRDDLVQSVDVNYYHTGRPLTRADMATLIATLQAALAEKEKEIESQKDYIEKIGGPIAKACVVLGLFECDASTTIEQLIKKVQEFKAKLKSAEAHANAVGDNNSQLTQQVSDLQLLNKELRDGRR